jgi:hypothetical protein
MLQIFGYLGLADYILTLTYSLLFSGAFLSILVFHHVQRDSYVDLSIIYLMALMLVLSAVLLSIIENEFNPVYFLVTSSLMLLRDVARFKASKIHFRTFNSVNLVLMICFCGILIFLDRLSIFLLVLSMTGILFVQTFPISNVKFVTGRLKILDFFKSLVFESPSVLGGFVAFIFPVYFLTTEDYVKFRVFSSYLAFATPLLSLFLVSNYKRKGSNSGSPSICWLALTLPFIILFNYDMPIVILGSIMVMTLCSAYFFSIIRVAYRKEVQFIALLIPPFVMATSYFLLDQSVGLNGSLRILGLGWFVGIMVMAYYFYFVPRRIDSE